MTVAVKCEHYSNFLEAGAEDRPSFCPHCGKETRIKEVRPPPTTPLRKPITHRIAILFVALCLSAGTFYMFRGSGFPQPNGNNFPVVMFRLQSKSLGLPSEYVPDQWRSRLAICFLTGKWLDWVSPQNREQFLNTFAAFPTAFVLGVFLLMIFTLNDAWLPMIGVMAGLVCNAMPELRPYILPWDMPAMFFFTAAFVAYRRKWWVALMVAVLLGALIKETVLVAAFFLLGAPWKWWTRAGAILALAATSQLIVKAITPVGASLSWTVALGNFGSNLHPTTLLKLWPDIFANGGGLVLLVWCLTKKRDWPLWLVVAAFVLGLKYTEISCGLYGPGQPPYTEFRDWSELLPLGWITVNDVLTNQSHE
jgi:hypothetical protein